MTDIIVGEREGNIRYYRRTGPGIHDLTYEGQLQVSGTPIDVGTCASPACMSTSASGGCTRLDWNEDGLYDLIAGNELASYSQAALTSEVTIFLNQGSNSNPVFPASSSLGDSFPFRGKPQVVDLNGDGKKDLVFGTFTGNPGNFYGRCMYFENTGTNSSPVFNENGGVFLELASGGFVQVASDAALCLNDWNEDGAVDIIMGDNTGKLTLFTSTGASGNQTSHTSIVPTPALRVRRNPVGDLLELTIDDTGAAQGDIRILDMSGRTVRREQVQLNDGTVIMCISDLSSGSYIVSLETEERMSSCFFTRSASE